MTARAMKWMAALALAAGGLAGVPGTAEAGTMPVVKIKPGETIVIRAPSPPVPGSGTEILVGTSPEDCSYPVYEIGTSEWCDSYPVEIDAPDELIKSGNLQLNVALEWKKGAVYVNNCPYIGNCGSNEMSMSMWQDPPVQQVGDRGIILVGDCEIPEGSVPAGTPRDTYTELVCPPAEPRDYPTAESEGAGLAGLFVGNPDPPITLAHAGAGTCATQIVPDPEKPVPANGICRTEFVNVVNRKGENPYVLTLELQDFTGSGPFDLSADDVVPITEDPVVPSDSSGSQSALVAPAEMPRIIDIPAFDSARGAGAPRVDLPGLGSSAGFDGIGPAGIGSSDLAQRIVDRGPKVLGAPGEANVLLLVLWLVLLPVGGLGSFLFFVWRRRREDGSADAAAVA